MAARAAGLLGPERVFDLQFASFRQDPIAAVGTIYDHLGFEFSDTARQRMQVYMQEHAEHAALNSPHGLIPFARVPEIRE